MTLQWSDLLVVVHAATLLAVAIIGYYTARVRRATKRIETKADRNFEAIRQNGLYPPSSTD